MRTWNSLEKRVRTQTCVKSGWITANLSFLNSDKDECGSGLVFVWFMLLFFCHLQINSYLTEQNEMYLSIVYSETVHLLVLASLFHPEPYLFILFGDLNTNQLSSFDKPPIQLGSFHRTNSFIRMQYVFPSIPTPR